MTELLLAIDPDRVKPGWLALLVVLAIAVALVILLRSMSRHLKKVDFPESEPGGEEDRSDTDA